MWTRHSFSKSVSPSVSQSHSGISFSAFKSFSSINTSFLMPKWRSTLFHQYGYHLWILVNHSAIFNFKGWIHGFRATRRIPVGRGSDAKGIKIFRGVILFSVNDEQDVVTCKCRIWRYLDPFWCGFQGQNLKKIAKNISFWVTTTCLFVLFFFGGGAGMQNKGWYFF